MSESDFANLDRAALIALVLHQATLIEQLRAEIQQLKRGDARQAAPFSKGKPVQNPQKPGRKPGQGPFKRREPPAPEQLSEPPIDVPVAEADCPGCGGPLQPDRVEEASITDLPEVVRPRVRLFRVAVKRCRRCGRTVRGRHRELAPDQRGATAHRLGPRLLAAAHQLHYGLGVTARKLPEVLGLLTGVRLTQGAVTQDALRRSERIVAATYQALSDSIREAPYVHTDDTGWRVRGRPAWLMVFVTDTATVYQVRERHRNEEVRERVPSDYAGVMITDRGKSYDAGELAGVRRQVCLAHVQRSITGVVDSKTGKSRWFGSHLKALLKRALALHHERRARPGPAFEARVHQLERELTEHLRDRVLRDDDNQRLLDGLGRHHDAGSLVRFLGEPGIEPTNNAAERALRPAVIARKVSQCTKTVRGTRAFEVWSSVLATWGRTLSGEALLDAIVARAYPMAPEIG
ncbi:MAG: IS66 family transposase [Acidimicrobiales bacterium]